MKKFRNAFTMVELVAVIVIFGIVAAIGSEIYVKIYENYMVSRVMNNLHTKTELAIEQIAKRLQYRIKDATIARKPPPNLNVIISTADPDLDDSYKILEWIGYDVEGLKGFYNGTIYTPAWSGFIDVEDSNATHLSTPGSDLDKEDNITKAVSHNQATIADAGIIFTGMIGDYNVSKYGWSPSSNTDYVYNIAEYNSTMFRITETNGTKEVYERYKLVWTAYAIVPMKNDSTYCTQADVDESKCNLYLFMNYQPWHLDAFYETGKNIQKYLLIERISTFKFKQDGDVIRLKLCVKDQIVGKDVAICKEKVVF